MNNEDKTNKTPPRKANVTPEQKEKQQAATQPPRKVSQSEVELERADWEGMGQPQAEPESNPKTPQR